MEFGNYQGNEYKVLESAEKNRVEYYENRTKHRQEIIEEIGG